MNFLKRIRDSLVLDRKENEALHAQVLREIESGIRRDGLWSKALVNAAGNEERAKAEYIKFVVQDLRDQQYVEGRINDLIKDELKGKETNKAGIVDQTSINSLSPSHQHPAEPIYQKTYGASAHEATYRKSKELVKTRKIEITSLIDAIKSTESPLSLKDKAKVIEMAGGLVSWNDPLDPSKGCTIVFEGLDRVFGNADSLEKWIDHIAIQRIQDYLLT